MAVWAVCELFADYIEVGDDYFMRFTALDGSEIAISMSGEAFEAHGATIQTARRKRAQALARCALKAIPGGKP